MGNCIENFFPKKTKPKEETLVQSNDLLIELQTIHDEKFYVCRGFQLIENFLDEVNLKITHPQSKHFFIKDKIKHIENFISDFQSPTSRVRKSLEHNKSVLTKYSKNNQQKAYYIKMEIQSLLTVEAAGTLSIEVGGKQTYLKKFTAKNKNSQIKKIPISQMIEFCTFEGKEIVLSLSWKAKATFYVDDLTRDIMIGDVVTLRNQDQIQGYVSLRSTAIFIEQKDQLEQRILKRHEALKRQLGFCLEGEQGWEKLSEYRYSNRSSCISQEPSVSIV